MELIDNFNEKFWKKGNANDDTGFQPYQIATRKVLDAKKGDFKYAVFDEEGDLHQLTLNGARGKDPLAGVGNVDLQLDAEKKTIKGIILLDECVLFSG